MARTQYEAAALFLSHFRRMLSCVTRDVPVNGGGYRVATDPHCIYFQNNPVPLRGEPLLALNLAHGYRIIEESGANGPWMVRTTFYYYALKGRDGREILSFHWRPELPRGSKDFVTTPYVHVGPGAEFGLSLLDGAHIPTNLIGLEEVLRFAIRDLRVQPLRRDWQKALGTGPSS